MKYLHSTKFWCSHSQRKQVFLAEIVIQGKKDEKGQYQFEKPWHV